MAELCALLTQRSPSLPTRRGLILLGLQNDFVSQDGKLPANDTDYLDRITELVPAFREIGNIIWVRTEFQSNRSVGGPEAPGDAVIVGSSLDVDEGSVSSRESSEDDEHTSSGPSKRFKSSLPKSSATFSRPDSEEEDEELFLTRTATREPCCLQGTRGSEFADRFKPMIIPKKDLQVTKSHYSAFASTSLLLTLRSKLITELFVCGNMTNLSVYATAVDAARYGIRITLVEDCLGYRSQERHNVAVKQLHDFMEADIMTSKEVINSLTNPPDNKDLSDHKEGQIEQPEDGAEGQGGEKEGEEVERSRRKPTFQQNQHDPLEVDSDEGDDEMSLPYVRRTGMLESRAKFPPSAATYSRSIANPRHATSKSSKPSSSKHTDNSSSKTTQRNIRGQEKELVKPRVDTNSDHYHSRLGRLDSPDSSEHSRRPWLNLVSSGTATKLHTVLRPKHPGLAALSSVGGLDASTIAEYEATMAAAQERNAYQADSKPLFGDGKEEESAGSRILYGLLEDEDADGIFDKLNSEVNWQSMYHQTGEVPRLVCCQGTMDDDSMPVYRHPSDQTIPLEPWTPIVDRVRKAAEKAVGHPLNHALVQLYRSGNDYISEHSDKSLDIAAGSNIVNVSFGAQRTMRLRTKRNATLPEGTRTTYRVPMPHNSMLVMSLPTNAQYLHGINWDRRPRNELIEAETAFGGQRISLTFRNIGTFLSRDSSKIWGQGAVAKTKEQARQVINGDPGESEKMVRAFGKENQASGIAWQEIYGEGFDVLHLK